MTPDEIRIAIAELPQENPARCEGLIRMLYKQISSLEDANEKEKLVNELRAVACLGLQEDLKNMMEKKGLHLEGMDLVVKYLTTVPELAQCLFASSKDEIEKAGLEIVKRRLGPDIEVLGALKYAEVDVTKKWVQKLCGRAPSLKALRRLRLRELEDCCQGADEGEMDQVQQLVETAESYSKQLSNILHDEKLVQQSKTAKAVDEEKLKQAKALMNEAKVMATDQSETAKQTVKEKIVAVMSKLELPTDWFRQDQIQPEQMFQQLDQIIEQCSNVVESGETYKSEIEIITKASAGRSLCGVYHSDYQAPKPAGRPLLQVPKTVTLTNPNSSQEVDYIRFSAKGSASEYVRTVASSSTNIGLGVAGFYGLFVGDVKGGYGSEAQTQVDRSVKTSTTSASVLQYIFKAKKTFQLERDKIRLSMTARKMAKSIVQDEQASTVKQEKSARLFLDRYGSHFPAGVQTLGGVFFTIADATSESTKETTKLTEAAVENLKGQIFVGFLSGAFGIGGSVTGEHTGTKGKKCETHKESNTENFTYSVRTMGPPATNPSTFHKLLSYNSTWALIDRGSFQGYIPVWELLREIGSEYEAAAQVLEETWCKDENKRKEEEQRRREKENDKNESWESHGIGKMVDIGKKTQGDVLELREHLKSMPADMRLFSLAMKSLYVDKAVGTSTEPARKFRKLRDDTRKDAMVYLKGVLPLQTKFVASISEYFEYYEALDFEHWREMLYDILEETNSYRELCETLVTMHEDVLVPLKKRKDEAFIIVTELKDLKQEFERKKEKLKGKGNPKRYWAIGLSAVPGIGLIASSVLNAIAELDMAEAVSKKDEAELQEAASITVSETLIPALEHFINGIRKVAGFFSVMEQELHKFQGKAEKDTSDPKYLYYKVMSKEAKDMKSVCQVFYAVLPDVRSDFLAIPAEGTDQNYIDRWLEKQKKMIKDKCKTGRLGEKLLAAITY